MSFRNKREQLGSEVTLLQLKPGKSASDAAKWHIFYSVDRQNKVSKKNQSTTGRQEIPAEVKGQKTFPGNLTIRPQKLN